jgi:hypothetical protein
LWLTFFWLVGCVAVCCLASWMVCWRAENLIDCFYRVHAFMWLRFVLILHLKIRTHCWHFSSQ